MNENELLRAYSAAGDGAALAELVRRYAPIVYAAARRQTHDAAMAEDVCQCVFVTFARRAAGVRSGAALGAWLLQTTRHTAANAMKIHFRRRRHEQAAALTRPEISPGSDPVQLLKDSEREKEWGAISPVLDKAISRLGWADQTAVVLRYFRGLSLREIAAVTGTTEDGARKRVSRAVDRLRKSLSASGVSAATCAVVELPLLLTRHAVEPAPAHVVAQAAGAAANSIPTGVLTMTGFKLLIGGIAAASVVAAIELSGRPATQPAIGADAIALAAATQPAAADWQDRINKLYRLEDGHYFKNVPPPFDLDRQQFFRSLDAATADMNPQANQLYLVQQPNGSFQLRGSGQYGGKGPRPVDVANRLAKLKPKQVQGDAELLDTPLDGDWVVRAWATPDQIMHGIAESVAAQVGRDVQVTRALVDFDVIVAAGSVRPPPGGDKTVHIVLGTAADTTAHSGGSGPGGSRLMNALSQATGIQFIDETSADSQRSVSFDISGHVDADKLGDADMKTLLKSLADQTGATFTRDRRPLEVWTLKIKLDK